MRIQGSVDLVWILHNEGKAGNVKVRGIPAGLWLPCSYRISPPNTKEAVIERVETYAKQTNDPWTSLMPWNVSRWEICTLTTWPVKPKPLWNAARWKSNANRRWSNYDKLVSRNPDACPFDYTKWHRNRLIETRQRGTWDKPTDLTSMYISQRTANRKKSASRSNRFMRSTEIRRKLSK